MTIDNKDGETQPEDSDQSRRTFLKKMGYVAPVIATYKIGDAWAKDDGGKKNKNSPNPGVKKKSRVEDDDD
ncbi:MAG: hypothetical protein ACI906_004884 [Candidatus Latescibacterota bacterium]|jgi:hypothetical protein